MSDAQHTPPGDASFRASVVRQVGGAVALVALVALIFWAIGSIGGSDTPVVSELPGSSGGEEDDGADATDGAADGTDSAAADDAGADDAPVDDAGADEADDGEVDDGADAADADADADGEADDEADDDQADAGDRAVDPGDVTVQVLDGVKSDGGAAADGVAAEVESAGYRIVARNIALDYEVTTVLYNPGNEAAAEQLAADIGGAEVRPQPGNLSDEVDLHVVVGRDRA